MTTAIRPGRLSPPIVALAALLAASSTAWSQTLPRPVGAAGDMTGPRFGITVRPVISQFGWQFEHRLYTNDDGLTMLTEWIPLLSGLDQGVALPSLNWLTGLRTPSGTEFGIGPNVTPLGVGLVLAAGVTVN